MTYQTEFPDYPVADMPEIPAGFADTSWRQDASPSFTSSSHGLTIWIDYVDLTKREFKNTHRFVVADVDGEDVLATDNWSEVLELIARRAK
jgi:hypothetical protein